LRTLRFGARTFVPVALAGAVLFGPASSPPVAASTTTTEAQQIIRIAKNQIADPWRYGADGPRAFDCSGLVRFAFRRADDGRVVRAGRLHSASALLRWFRDHGKASRHHPKRGDLVIWGGGSHVGIYIGDGKAISTLRSGVRVHRVNALTAPFTAYLHTGMSTKSAD
jgi:cell wall-associated NlpC family hydrolase